jgi:hypothetical protein
MTEPNIGDEMEDGTIYAGISPDTHKPMFTTPWDEPVPVPFKEAATQAGALSMTNAFGHHDWHVPSKNELNVLWENRDKGKLKGTFNESGSYWSSSPYIDGNIDFLAWAQRFGDGYQQYSHRNHDLSLRCVR